MKEGISSKGKKRFTGCSEYVKIGRILITRSSEKN
jgi:hypothetical protein